MREKLSSAVKRIFTFLNPGRLRAASHALSKRERFLFWLFAIALGVGVLWAGVLLYLRKTTVVPAFGGVYIEGVVGSPRFINPVLGGSSEADRALEAILFAGLFKPDHQGGVIPELAESVDISQNKKSYTVTLKKNLVWHDGRPLTADDVLFTIEIIKNPELRNPLAPNWQGVNVEKISGTTLRFTIPTPYEGFLNSLSFGIVPKHLWGEIPPQNFPFEDLNLKPIGAGPYRFKNLKRDTRGAIAQYTLVANRNYSGPGPYLDTVVIRFFQTYDDAILALKKKEIHGLAGIPPENARAVTSASSMKILRPVIPRYFAVFLNIESQLFQDINVRAALSHATDKKKLIAAVLRGEAKEISSPIVPGLPGAADTTDLYDPEEARRLISLAGWKENPEDRMWEKRLSSRDKNPTKLSFELLFLDTPELRQVAEALKESWARAGIGTDVKPLSVGEFTSAMQSRTYRAILFGEVLSNGRALDPFPFWHSSQKTPPGLNLSLYANPAVDVLLEKIRREEDNDQRSEMLNAFQSLIAKDYPAVFLYSPEYPYAFSATIRVPEMRFLNSPQERLRRINEWFLNTRRVWRPK